MGPANGSCQRTPASAPGIADAAASWGGVDGGSIHPYIHTYVLHRYVCVSICGVCGMRVVSRARDKAGGVILRRIIKTPSSIYVVRYSIGIGRPANRLQSYYWLDSR